MQQSRRPLPGEPAPWFFARSSANPRYAFNTVGGHYIALTFVENGQEPGQKAVLREMAARSAGYDDQNAVWFIVTASETDEAPGALPLRLPGIRAFYDFGREVRALYGIDQMATGRAVTVIISPRLQVLGYIGEPDPVRHAETVERALASQTPLAKLQQAFGPPPILIIPHVFERELCRTLIEGYERNGGTISGFMREENGKTVPKHDKNHKVRRDWMIEDRDLVQTIQQRVVRRIIPEIEKAYNFRVTQMERYMVACYDAQEGGHFRAHRDNTTKGTAHRRFACSINLNSEEFEGGNLRFPEFGSQTYRPPTGGCVIFGCSLLHEVVPVTKGRRYAFLPFFYDEAAAKIRQENLAFLDTGQIPPAPPPMPQGEPEVIRGVAAG